MWAAGSASVRELHMIVVGEPGHPEVEGILGHAGDDAQVVSCAADAGALPLKGKVGLVVQTTQTTQSLAEVVASITPRVQELRVINTICAATSERQQQPRRLPNAVIAWSSWVARTRVTPAAWLRFGV